MARRSGQIISRGERKWLVRWYVGEVNGHYKYKSKTVHGTKREAQKLLTSMLRSQDLGEYVEPQKITLDKFLDRWLDSAAKSVSPRTLGNMRSILGKHVRPVLGGYQIQRISTMNVQAMIDGMSERAGRELSPRTHQLARRYLSQALRQAVDWQMLTRNPAQGVNLPKRASREKRAFSADEVRRLRRPLGERSTPRSGTSSSRLVAAPERPSDSAGRTFRSNSARSASDRPSPRPRRGGRCSLRPRPSTRTSFQGCRKRPRSALKRPCLVTRERVRTLLAHLRVVRETAVALTTRILRD